MKTISFQHSLSACMLLAVAPFCVAESAVMPTQPEAYLQEAVELTAKAEHFRLEVLALEAMIEQAEQMAAILADNQPIDEPADSIAEDTK